MPLNDCHDTLPESSWGASFTKAEWARADDAVEKMRARLAKTCRHLVVNPNPTKKRRVDWVKVHRERKAVEQRLQEAKRAAWGLD